MKLSDKYPEAYFEHFLAMLATMNTEINEEGYKSHIEHYIEFEGKSAMRALQNEIALILKNDDLIRFLNITQEFDLDEVDQNSLHLMSRVIQEWSE